MTTPNTGHLFGSVPSGDLTATTQPLTAVRRSAITGMYVTETAVYDGVDGDGAPVNYRTEFYVMALAANAAAPVASFATQADANAYITTDPDGLLSS